MIKEKVLVEEPKYLPSGVSHLQEKSYPNYEVLTYPNLNFLYLLKERRQKGPGNCVVLP